MFKQSYTFLVCVRLKKYQQFYMAIITLTTDFGEKDHFAGATKGAIYNELPETLREQLIQSNRRRFPDRR